MKFIFALLGLVVIALVPAVVDAGNSQVITITAQPWSTGDCPTDFVINAVSLYEVQMTWTNGGNMTTAVLRGAYGRWPGNATDGFEVYTGNGTSVTHWVNTEFIGVDVYYRLWGLQSGNYSYCYASGTVQGGEGVATIGSGVILLPLIIFALGSMVSAYVFRKTPIAFVAAAAWTVLGFYSFTQSSSDNPAIITDFWMALFWVGISMVIVSVFEPVIMKSPDEKLEDLDKPEEEEDLGAEYARLRKEMGFGMFKSKKKKGLKPG